MTQGQTVQLAWAVGAIVLVMSALSIRRIGFGAALRMIAGWIVIFAVALLIYSYRFELNQIISRVAGDLTGSDAQVVGGELRVPMSSDGHFWVDGRVNGVGVRFLVDSGATMTAVSAATVREAGLAVDDGGFPVILQTAGGQITARRSTIERLEVGPMFMEDITVVTSPSFGDLNVVGMNFLSRLGSWRVEGRTLILTPQSPRSQGYVT